MSKKHFNTSLLVLLNACSILAIDFCPLPVNLKPCTCDLEGINCNSAMDATELKHAFSSPPKEPRFRTLWMFGTPLTFLQDETFGNYSFQTAHIQYNDIAEFGQNVFKGSRLSLKSMIVSNNRLKSLPLSSVTELKLLENLHLSNNLIRVIDSHAFGSTLNIKTLDLSSNKIIFIGEFAFSGLHQIQHLDLSNNQLDFIGDHTFHNPFSNTFLFLSMSNNKIERIDSDAFSGMAGGGGDTSLAFNKLASLDGLQPLVTKLATHKTGRILLIGNAIRCDRKLAWLLLLEESLLTRIFGVTCNNKPLSRVTIDDLVELSSQ